jgi:hypothetical protein
VTPKWIGVALCASVAGIIAAIVGRSSAATRRPASVSVKRLLASL